ncbi:hypothetical protein ACTXT7_014947 [Hymenolepis weldensis]
MCHFSTCLNAGLEDYYHSHPVAEDIFAAVNGGICFEELDLSETCLEVEIKPECFRYLDASLMNINLYKNPNSRLIHPTNGDPALSNHRIFAVFNKALQSATSLLLVLCGDRSNFKKLLRRIAEALFVPPLTEYVLNYIDLKANDLSKCNMITYEFYGELNYCTIREIGESIQLEMGTVLILKRFSFAAQQQPRLGVKENCPLRHFGYAPFWMDWLKTDIWDAHSEGEYEWKFQLDFLISL